MTYRTDINNNPTAFTTDIAKEAKLVEGVDYIAGSPFEAGGMHLFTAKLLGNPIDTTVKVIDRLGFYTPNGQLRWAYIGMPRSIWDSLPLPQKIYIICFMYRREMGYEMIYLFPTSAVTKLNFDTFSQTN